VTIGNKERLDLKPCCFAEAACLLDLTKKIGLTYFSAGAGPIGRCLQVRVQNLRGRSRVRVKTLVGGMGVTRKGY